MKNQNTSVALLAGIASAILAGAVFAQPTMFSALASSYNTSSSGANETGDDSGLTTFEEEALKAEEDTTTAGNATTSNMTESATQNATMNDTGNMGMMPAPEGNTIALQGTVSSPGEEAGPFQVVDLLPPTLDGNIYVGWLSFTASKPILVAPLHTYGVANETLDPEVEELFVFPGMPNGTMIAPAITMPDYTSQDDTDADFPTPDTYSATVPFAASGLSIGRLDGEQFIVSYTLYATLHQAQTIDNVEGAITNETEVEGVEATIVSGAAFQNETAYSPNPIQVESGDTVTWVNKDFDPHTVTSGTYMDEDAGDEFDSGYMGPQSSFSFTFEDDGEFEYFCQLHPNMVGTVQVE